MEGFKSHRKPGMEHGASRPVLDRTPAEQAALFHSAQGGDEEARAELIMQNFPLVVDTIRRQGDAYLHRGLRYRDLEQEGALALINAVDKFDPDKGYRFSTYAVTCIENGLREAVREARAIRFPAKHDRRARKVAEAEIRFSEPSVVDLSLATGLSAEEVQDVLDHRPEVVVSLDSLIPSSDEDHETLAGVIPDPDQLDPHDTVPTEIDRQEQISELERLKDDDRAALVDLFDMSCELPDGRVVLFYKAAAEQQHVPHRHLRQLTEETMKLYGAEANDAVVDGDNTDVLRGLMYSLVTDHPDRFQSPADASRYLGIHERRGRRLFKEAAEQKTQKVLTS